MGRRAKLWIFSTAKEEEQAFQLDDTESRSNNIRVRSVPESVLAKMLDSVLQQIFALLPIFLEGHPVDWIGYIGLLYHAWHWATALEM